MGSPNKTSLTKTERKTFQFKKVSQTSTFQLCPKKTGGKNRNPNPLSPVRVAVLQHMDRLSFWATFDAKVTWKTTSSPAGGNDFKPRRSVTSTSDIWSRLRILVASCWVYTKATWKVKTSKNLRDVNQWDMAQEKTSLAKPKKKRSHLDCDFFIGRFVVTNYTP